MNAFMKYEVSLKQSLHVNDLRPQYNSKTVGTGSSTVLYIYKYQIHIDHIYISQSMIVLISFVLTLWISSHIYPFEHDHNLC